MESELTRLERILSQKGYRKSCDIPTCNCGDSWAHGGNAETRLQEFHQALVDADVETQGKTLLTANRDALAEVARLREVNAGLAMLLRLYIAAYPAFRMKPIGAKGSPMRIEQENLIALEDAARSAIAAQVQK